MKPLRIVIFIFIIGILIKYGPLITILLIASMVYMWCRFISPPSKVIMEYDNDQYYDDPKYDRFYSDYDADYYEQDDD